MRQPDLAAHHPTGAATERPHDPNRIAVALHYDHKGAPRVTAKGRGYVAEEILARSAVHGIVQEQNAILAEALSDVTLDDEIPEALYRAVAEILGFVLRAARP